MGKSGGLEGKEFGLYSGSASGENLGSLICPEPDFPKLSNGDFDLEELTLRLLLFQPAESHGSYTYKGLR